MFIFWDACVMRSYPHHLVSGPVADRQDRPAFLGGRDGLIRRDESTQPSSACTANSPKSSKTIVT
jgi:hypothetical protein